MDVVLEYLQQFPSTSLYVALFVVACIVSLGVLRFNTDLVE